MFAFSRFVILICAWGGAAVADFSGEGQLLQATQPSTIRERPAQTQPGDGARVVRPFPDVEVHLGSEGQSTVEVKAWTCLDSGLLEQIACAPQTREHESLVVIKAKPSQLHAALLMAGFKPGAPGKWVYEDEKLRTIAPTGEKLAILVRYSDLMDASKTIEKPVSEWIRANADSKRAPGSLPRFPSKPWVFGGSVIAAGAPGQTMPEQGDEHYVADRSGSIIGLVTFGDEVIGFADVLADQESVSEPIWEVNAEAVPPPGTKVTVVIRKWQEPPASEPEP